MTLLIAFAVLSILVSFICSILEAALLSLTPSYIAQQKADKRADESLQMQKDENANAEKRLTEFEENADKKKIAAFNK